jgi:5-methylthioadenosine/S-adenosylhomocysteine deaminase
LGGARALGLDKRIGSIEPGKDADLAAFDLSAIETQPTYDVISQIVYAAGREQTSDVWVAGTPVVRKRQALFLRSDAERNDPVAQAVAWQNRCRQILQASGAL